MTTKRDIVIDWLNGRTTTTDATTGLIANLHGEALRRFNADITRHGAGLDGLVGLAKAALATSAASNLSAGIAKAAGAIGQPAGYLGYLVERGDIEESDSGGLMVEHLFRHISFHAAAWSYVSPGGERPNDIFCAGTEPMAIPRELAVSLSACLRHHAYLYYGAAEQAASLEIESLLTASTSATVELKTGLVQRALDCASLLWTNDRREADRRIAMDAESALAQSIMAPRTV